MLAEILPYELYNLLDKYVNFNKLFELRLRENSPIILNISNSVCSINSNGLCNIKSGYVCSKDLIEKVIALASENSIYAIENQLKMGYITASCGIRIGVVGEFVKNNDSISTLKNISSLNIRLPHNVIGCSNKVMPYIVNDDSFYIHNTLILSPPGAGKTTLLRDIIYNITNLKVYTNCLVIDERFEIVGKNNLNNFFSIGKNVDVIFGGDKFYSINCGVRSMAPNIIFTDEIATCEDANSIIYAKNCGVNVIATMHAKNINDFTQKLELNTLFTKKVFDRYIVLSSRNGVGTIDGVYDNNFKLLYCE